MNEEINEHESSCETFSSSEIEFNITKLTHEDLEQIIRLNQKCIIYEDVLKISNIIIDKCDSIKSGELVLGYFGFVNYKMIAPYLSKKCKKNIREIGEDFVILLCERILNVPLYIILEALKKMLIRDDFIVLSMCDELNGRDYLNICQDFVEFETLDLKYFPRKTEEIFYLNYNNGMGNFIVKDVYYRYFKMNIKLFNKYIDKIVNEIKN